MIIGIIILVVLIIILSLYVFFFKEYSEVMANFETLVKVLETRDLILMRILPEIKNKSKKEEITKLVSDRMEAKSIGNNELVKADVEINKRLKPLYDEFNKSPNPIVKEGFRRIVHLEKQLKVIRREYNKSVEKYNDRIVKHPKIYIKHFHMKPLDNYNFIKPEPKVLHQK